MKRMNAEDRDAAAKYAINPHGRDHSKLEERHFELGARRILDYLTAHGFVEREP